MNKIRETSLKLAISTAKKVQYGPPGYKKIIEIAETYYEYLIKIDNKNENV